MSKSRHTQSVSSGSAWPLILYGVMLSLYGIASMFPDTRLWGINFGAFFSGALFAAMIGGFALAAGALYLLTGNIREEAVDAPDAKAFLYPTCLISVILTASFWFLPGATHFLGDGYQLLARLSSGAAPVKEWEIGAMKLEDAIFSLLSGDPNSRAFMAFRLISLVSGVLFLATLLIASIKLFSRNLDHLLFFLGIATGGYMLLFFGYVENYPVFVLAVLAFCLIGVLIVKGAISRWWILLPFVVAQAFHVFGVTLVPALLYVLIRPTRIGRGIGRISIRNRALIVSAALITGIGFYFYLCSHNLLFRFAVLPLAPDRLTIPGDTLFSGSRLLDLANFLLVLVPGLPILVMALWRSRLGKLLHRPDITFLLIFTSCAWGAVFVFDPKLGLPRDWDLFSFAGVPMATILFYGILVTRRQAQPAIRTVGLAILLALFVLGFRVAIHSTATLGLDQFKNYARLDLTKNKNTRATMIGYYVDNGDSLTAIQEREKYDRDYPETVLGEQSKAMIDSNRFAQAIPLCRQEIAFNPVYSDAYSNLGICYLSLGYIDSAVILCSIADALNPNSSVNLNNLGTAYLRKGDYKKAVKTLLRSLELDSTLPNAKVNLAVTYVALDELDKSFQYLKSASVTPEVPAKLYQMLADAYAQRGRADLAIQATALAERRSQMK